MEGSCRDWLQESTKEHHDVGVPDAGQGPQLSEESGGLDLVLDAYTFYGNCLLIVIPQVGRAKAALADHFALGHLLITSPKNEGFEHWQLGKFTLREPESWVLLSYPVVSCLQKGINGCKSISGKSKYESKVRCGSEGLKNVLKLCG